MAGEQILIVDDEIDVLQLCERILRANGYEVKTARTAHEAIVLARQISFDLLLTDIKMPQINGLEIARNLKKYDPGVICVAMTGYGTIDVVLDALKMGIDEFILKPFTPDELNFTILKASEKDRLRKENFRLRSLIPLFELNKTLMRTVEVDKVLHRLLEISQEETKASLAGLYLSEEGQMGPHWYQPGPAHEQSELKQAATELARAVLTQGRQISFTVRDPNEMNRALLKQIEGRALIATPIKTKDSTLGVLILARRNSNFAPSDRDFLSVLASQAGIALENARLFTQIQASYRKLQKLDQMKQEFINIAAHELRTPLTVLMGYANVLEEDLSGPTKEFAASISRNTLRLRSLIDDMLNLNFLESGIARLSSNRLRLQEAMNDLMKDMSLLAEEKQLTVTIDIPEEFPPIITDRQKFDLIVMNLFHNAVKFTPPGGKVSLQARANGDTLRIAVQDTGIGIPAEQIEHIFDRFYQVEPSLTREHGGIGLGLAIARALAQVCGGKIQVSSEEGAGATFTLILPLDNTHLVASKLTL